jgi:hypothetical protein
MDLKRDQAIRSLLKAVTGPRYEFQNRELAN